MTNDICEVCESIWSDEKTTTPEKMRLWQLHTEDEELSDIFAVESDGTIAGTLAGELAAMDRTQGEFVEWLKAGQTYLPDDLIIKNGRPNYIQLEEVEDEDMDSFKARLINGVAEQTGIPVEDIADVDINVDEKNNYSINVILKEGSDYSE